MSNGLAIGKNGDTYQFAFTTEDGKATIHISVRQSGATPDQRTDDEKKSLALKKLKRLAQALDSAVVES